MTPAECNRQVLDPALDLLPARFDSPAARIELLAIGLQESELIYRRQYKGPARGLWQHEEIGVAGVFLNNARIGRIAEDIAIKRHVKPDSRAVYVALEHDDILAAAIARLTLALDPNPLPTDYQAGWSAYLRAWRPGHPRPEDWPNNWKQAVEALAL